MIDWIEIIGWIAAFLTIATYSMRTMLPLRITAIFSNIFFASYGGLTETYQILFLHIILLPFNVYRATEILRNMRKIKLERQIGPDFSWIRSMARPSIFLSGQYVFRKGDTPDYFYYIDEGEVILDEIDVTLNQGEVFGEIAFFTDAKERTVSARCSTDCKIIAIHEERFISLFYQNPAFGFSMAQLITKRLMAGVEKMPGAYLAVHKKKDDVAERTYD